MIHDPVNRRAAMGSSVLALAGASLPARAQSVAPPPDETVLPGDTDPAIQTFNYPQGVWYPRGMPRRQLFIMLGGTNSKAPLGLHLSMLASQLGYHVIQPIYPNDVALDVCQNDADPDSFAKFRLAIIEGGERPHKPPVPRAESLENRTIKLLAYLHAAHPDQRWDHYLDGDAIAWETVVSGGMSQGAGHAGIIAARHKAARVFCLGGPKDFSTYSHSPAAWMSNPATPSKRWFAFNNTHDKVSIVYDQQIANLTALGVVQLAGTANVDGAAPPYDGSHALYTNWPGPDAEIESGKAHGSTINDNIPGPGGRPLFADVWNYMLTAPVA
jgi:hypothetical protein